MIKVTGNKIAVVPLENPDMIGHIIVPDIAKERLNQGLVKYMGPKCKDTYIGQYVLFSAYTGTLTYVEGEGKLIILPEDWVIAEVSIASGSVNVPGLFFKGRENIAARHVEIFEAIEAIAPRLEKKAIMQITDGLCKAGLYGPAGNPYFTATYEKTMEYVAMAFSENKEWRDKIKVVNKKHDVEETI